MPSKTLSRAVLFDLDGTLTDPKPGITRCIQYALSKLGYTPPHAEDLCWCIGPPLQQSFAELLQTSDRAIVDRALSFYRDRFSTIGLFENTLYPQIPEILQSFRVDGFRAFVVTSKPHIYATRIIDHFALSSWFDRVYGSELDGTHSNKGDLIHYVLQTEQIVSTDAVMIGDRKHDMIGAKQNSVCAIGVTYGYGTASELTIHGADFIVNSPHHLPALIETILGILD
ncbi:HAD family hydrolase [Phormidesmis priestleyi ULC007]|uniref:HAD family hydrolase n=1 Tax=Phormidesmis priestleyi ULC007 TaxID=1920490 RepID=A0A2T1DI18_9CYAN|nr:HAD family hydrolase [Phormidesmis priestleyi]PSB20123.1 HAD family hydrolase [Phormidesmis priestleyi ULC007]PZO49052.1 MAG: HAD family hydrolase [Phormidesmis priestleyi]